MSAVQQMLLGGGGGGDPYWADRVLLLHGHGTDGSGTIIDSTGRTITNAGAIEIDSAYSQYGGTSLKYPGTATGYWSTAYSYADHDWWTSDTTIECWIRLVAAGTYPCIIGNFNPSSGVSYWSLGVVSGALKFDYWKGTGAAVSGGTVPTDTWAHVAFTFTYATGVIRLWIDGVEVASLSTTGTPQSTTSEALVSGRLYSSSMTAWIDELRYSRRLEYTSTFTPAGPFPDA